MTLSKLISAGQKDQSYIALYFLVALFPALLFLNPLYIILALAIIPIPNRFQSFCLLGICVSLAMHVANRDIGVRWGIYPNFGIDDAPGYLTLASANLESLLSFGINSFEPLYLIILAICQQFSFSDPIIVFLSVLVPCVLLFLILRRSNEAMLLIAALLFISPAWINALFHLYRFSLAIPFILALVLVQAKSPWSLLFFVLGALLSHGSAVVAAMATILSIAYVRVHLKYRYAIVTSAVLMPTFAGLAIERFGSNFEKVQIYTAAGVGDRPSTMYLLIAAFALGVVLLRNKRDEVVVWAAAAVGCISSFIFVSGVIAERFSLLGSIIFCGILIKVCEGSKIIRRVIIGWFMLAFVRNVSIVENEQGYEPKTVFSFISSGEAYSPFKGIIRNGEELMLRFKIK